MEREAEEQQNTPVDHACRAERPRAAPFRCGDTADSAVRGRLAGFLLSCVGDPLARWSAATKILSFFMIPFPGVLAFAVLGYIRKLFGNLVGGF